MSQLLQTTDATDATATLYDRHHRRIRGYCLGQLHDCEEANDAVQSTFLYAFSSLQKGVAPRNELPWLFTIAHNVCRTRRRSLRRRNRLESGVDIDSVSETVGRDDPSHDDLEHLGEALAALPENQRRALLLREWQGLSYAEVAERLGVTDSAVEAVLFRARRNLAQKLRATDRLASLGALVATNLRRLGSLAGLGKTAAATLAIGLAAGTVLRPYVEPSRRPPANPGHEVRIAGATGRPPARAGAAPPSPVRQVPHHLATRVVGRAVGVQPAHVVDGVKQTAARSTPPQRASTPQPVVPVPEPAVATEPPAADPGPARIESTQASAQPAPAAAAPSSGGATAPADPLPAPAAPNLVPPQVQSALPNATLPDPSTVTDQVPSLPQVPQVDVPTVTTPTVSVPTPPQVPSLPPVPVTTPTLPNLTPPSSSTDDSPQSAPLQLP